MRTLGFRYFRETDYVVPYSERGGARESIYDILN